MDTIHGGMYRYYQADLSQIYHKLRINHKFKNGQHIRTQKDSTSKNAMNSKKKQTKSLCGSNEFNDSTKLYCTANKGS